MSCAIELVTAPFTLYWAPLETAFPDVDAAPTAPWTQIGTLGARRYTEEGVSISWDIETEDFVSLGDIDPECVFLTGRNLMVSVTMADLSLDQLRLALNLNTVSDVAGPPPSRQISMTVGPELTAIALLVRGEDKSPEFEGGNLQFQFANVIEVGSKEVTFVKGEPAGVQLEFRVLAGVKLIVAEDAT
jgi:hypothetical protein